MGIKQMENTLSDIFIATDPDADRMALVALHRGKPFIFNGNQIACLCLEYLCRMLKNNNRMPPNAAVVTTIVSTDLISRICQENGLPCFEVLTGFKYIGELIHKWEVDRSHHFLFGAEESYGYLIGTHSRDKDAIVMSCLIAEIALLMKVEGRTLVDFLTDIFKTYGLFYEKQRTVEFPPGKTGIDTIEQMMQTLRQKPPQSLLNQEVIQFKDYLNGIDNLPKSNVLLFRLKDNSKIVVRPSGTEPKLKLYAGIHEPQFTTLDSGLKTCDEKIEKLLNAVQALF